MEAFINNLPIAAVLLLLVAGIVFLVEGADFFVDGSADIARRLKISPLVIGMTVVSIGTSLPEFSVSAIASLTGKNALAISNVTGSNIFNLLVVIGVCAVLANVEVERETIRMDIPFLLLCGLILVVPFAVDLISGAQAPVIGRGIGLVLVVLFVYYIYSMIKRARKHEIEGTDEPTAVIDNTQNNSGSLLKSLFFIVVGCAAIIVGGDLTVDTASRIALELGMSQTLVGLTIVSIGTSLPELVTSIVAVRKGELGMALGNGIGSCVFNILMIVGFASLISPIALMTENIIDIVIMLVFIVITWLLAATGRKITRLEGALMLCLYAAYMVYIVLR